MRTIVAALRSSLLIAVATLGCAGPPSTGAHVDAITGLACTIDPGSYQPLDPALPTPHVACGPHDDVEPHPAGCCEFPQPGCDRNGCCDDEVVDGEPGDGDGPIVH
ncbi:MAG: hypothetical protein IPL61_19160 [Myxococcales bacterium]|nr:hypothetical protein [Myxococcales bacterium]